MLARLDQNGDGMIDQSIDPLATTYLVDITSAKVVNF